MDLVVKAMVYGQRHEELRSRSSTLLSNCEFSLPDVIKANKLQILAFNGCLTLVRKTVSGIFAECLNVGSYALDCCQQFLNPAILQKTIIRLLQGFDIDPRLRLI